MSRVPTGAQDDVQIEIVGDDLAGYQTTLPTGQVYKGKTKDELLHAVVKAQLHSSLTLREKEQQLQETRRSLEQQDKQRRPAADDGEEKVFDREAFNAKYWELINKDPLAAIEFANSVYFEDENPRASFAKSKVVSDFVSDAVATREFLKDNEDFPASKENGARLVDETLDAGLELTTANLERTWKSLKRDNLMTPLTQEQIAEDRARANGNYTSQDVVTPAAPRRMNPPPSPGGTNEEVGDTTQNRDAELDNFAVMSKAQREEILKKRGMM